MQALHGFVRPAFLSLRNDQPQQKRKLSASFFGNPGLKEEFSKYWRLHVEFFVCD